MVKDIYDAVYSAVYCAIGEGGYFGKHFCSGERWNHWIEYKDEVTALTCTDVACTLGKYDLDTVEQLIKDGIVYDMAYMRAKILYAPEVVKEYAELYDDSKSTDYTTEEE